MAYYFGDISYFWPDEVTTTYFFLVTTTYCIGNFVQFSASLRTQDFGETLAKSFYVMLYTNIYQRFIRFYVCYRKFYTTVSLLACFLQHQLISFLNRRSIEMKMKSPVCTICIPWRQ